MHNFFSTAYILILSNTWMFSISLASHAIPCCEIHFLSPTSIGPFFDVSQIYIQDLTTCSFTNVAQIQTKGTDLRSVHKNICSNGFSVTSFLITLIQRLGNQASESELQLLELLKESIKSYSSHMSVATTDTSRFKLNSFK